MNLTILLVAADFQVVWEFHTTFIPDIHFTQFRDNFVLSVGFVDLFT